MALIQWLLNALNAFTTQSISLPSKSAPKPTSNGELSAAPIVSMPSILNLTGSTCLVEVKWTSQTTDGLFGSLSVDGKIIGKACTNLNDRILDGVYVAAIDLSPHLGYRCPHLVVPLRDNLAPGGDAGLRIHVLNTPCQSEGCIGPGDSLDGDAVDSSKDAFDRLMSLLPQSEPFQVSIVSSIAS